MSNTGVLQEGQDLDQGRYRILSLLGRGGMGEVYLARDEVLERPVAIKTIGTKFQNDQDAQERFLREAKATAKVKHDNVIKIHDVRDSNGLVYMVMDFVDGQDLSRIAGTDELLDWRQVMLWIRDAASGLAAVHESELIHRDIKPANLMLAKDSGRVIVMDFGLVRKSDPNLTMTQGLIGTPNYMSPEQRREETLDARTDIYSLGVTTYFLLTKTHPSEATGSTLLSFLSLESNRIVVRNVRRDIPRRASKLIAWMMLPNRKRRIASAEKLVSEIDKLLSIDESPRWNWNWMWLLAGLFLIVSAGLIFSSFDFFGTSHPSSTGEWDDDLALRWCPAGTFTMGSPVSEPKRGVDEAQAQVTITRGFWIGETEVTQKLWRRVMGTVPWQGNADVLDDPLCPAVHVSHSGVDSATEFCEKFTESERAAGRLPQGFIFRLPTEAEWEYACRAGSRSAYGFGPDPARLSEHSWFEDNAARKGERHAHRVGLKPGNAWGVKDMHGNVMEWCSDWNAQKLTGGDDPQGAANGESRAFRGGSWSNAAEFHRSADRGGLAPHFRSSEFGFRIVLAPPLP